jgi:hypothetical protein
MQLTIFQNIMLVVGAINNTTTLMQMYQLHCNSYCWTWWKQQVLQVSNTSVASITQQELHHTGTLLFKTKYIYNLLHSSTVTQLSHNKLIKFYILLTSHLVMILGKWPTWRTILFYVFISILYMFWATSCSSSGESVVSIQPLVYVTLCRWPFRVQVIYQETYKTYRMGF